VGEQVAGVSGSKRFACECMFEPVREPSIAACAGQMSDVTAPETDRACALRRSQSVAKFIPLQERREPTVHDPTQPTHGN
jgi:hypothetical protein